MKTLILFASKKGMTEKLAYLVKEKRNNAEIYEIKKFNKDLNNYDEIIFGSPVYMGKINKFVKKYIDENFELLKTKSPKLFLCGMNYDNTEEVVNLNFSENQIKTLKIDYIGGAYNFEKLNFLLKFMIKKISGETKSREVIFDERIEKLIK